MIKVLRDKSNEIGILSSTLCIIHCVATPFLLAVIPVSSAINGGAWWGWLDLVFLAVSLLAVVKAVQQSRVTWIKISMVITFLLLTGFIFNERLEGIEFPFDMVYIPAFSLIVLHIVNRRHCQCETGCCEPETSK